MKVDPSLLIQLQARENAQEVESFIQDLKKWEEGIKQEEQNVHKVPGVDSETLDKTHYTKDDLDCVKSLYENGIRQIKEGKWDLAVSSFSNAIRKYKKNPIFFLKRAKCYLMLNKSKEAEADCSSALSLDSNILKAKLYRSKAREMAKNYKGACLDLQDILILDPINEGAITGMERLRPLAMASLRKENPGMFDQEEPSSEEDHAVALVKHSCDDQTENNIARANEEKDYGNALFKAGKLDEAIEAYSKAIAIYPLDAIYYANRGLCYLKDKQEHRAIIDCGMALKLNPSYTKAYFRRASAYQATGNYWGARSDIKKLLKLEPGNVQAKNNLEELNLLIESTFSIKEDEPMEVDDDGTNQDNPEESKENFKIVLPIEKPIHKRSKKPLKRVSIDFVDEESNAPSHSTPKKDSLPDLNIIKGKESYEPRKTKSTFIQQSKEVVSGISSAGKSLKKINISFVP